MRLVEVGTFEGVVRGSIGLLRVRNWPEKSKAGKTHRLQQAKPQTVAHPAAHRGVLAGRPVPGRKRRRECAGTPLGGPGTI